MKIAASSDLGGLGPNEGKRVDVEWRWYYHVASFAGWALVVALLVVVKENRNRYAWTILIPFLLLGEIVWPGIVRLLAMPSSASADLGSAFSMLLAGWTAIWLVSPWLARYRPLAGFLLAAGVAIIVGVVPSLWTSGAVLTGPSPLINGVSVFALLLAMVMASRRCRKSFSPARFLAWLAPSLIIVLLLCFLGWMLLAAVVLWGLPGGHLIMMLPAVVIGTLVFGIFLYLVNVPYMYLAFRCPPYRERFHKVLRLPGYEQPGTMPEE